jgi:two-component system, NtrC family, response regulator GlrR
MFEAEVVEGFDAGKRIESTSDELSIGTSDGNDLQLGDPSVSRHHCVIRVVPRGLMVTDLKSRNGTTISGIEIATATVPTDTELVIGLSRVRLRILDRELSQPLSPVSHLGGLVGASPEMRRMYSMIERAAASTTTILVEGETGTGKELVAEAIHDASPRRRNPLVTIDCGALSHALAESELFGHERGAFTGADVSRAGVIEEAAGGTVFLDEVGELPLELQPLLLRVLENRTVRRVGSSEQRPVDVRFVAATHRDLRAMVNAKAFRADLYFRLNVLRIVVPPLRERADDIEALATRFWCTLRDDAPPPALLRHVRVQPWPGNVRELRNAIERVALVGWKSLPSDAPRNSYLQAKAEANDAWEREWIGRLLDAHEGNLSRASRAAQMGRTRLRELARRHGLIERVVTDANEPGNDSADTVLP